MRRWGALFCLAAAAVAATAASAAAGRFLTAPQRSPIQHVVILFQENHSFDNVLGRWCAQTRRCNGAIDGRLPNRSTISLARSPDLVPSVWHRGIDAIHAIDGGRMDGWTQIPGCRPTGDLSANRLPYGCYTQYEPSQIPNLVTLATHFASSDATFALHPIPSWQAHIDLVAMTLDGFATNPGPNPYPSTSTTTTGPGWGCNSFRDADWLDPQGQLFAVPSCVPDYRLDPAQFPHGGAYRETPVEHVPTIMDELDSAGLSWRIYEADAGSGGWAICPTFAGCWYTQQRERVKSSLRVLTDAAAGRLPALSLVDPLPANSQHNNDSMAQGDNWIGQALGAIMNGPKWSSTVVFITYDDCGCFYDHVPPPSAGLGMRVPMVIVSPYARRGYVDHHEATFASMLSFTEHVLGLPPLTAADASAYDFSGAFNFFVQAAAPAPMVQQAAPAWEKRYAAKHGSFASGDT